MIGSLGDILFQVNDDVVFSIDKELTRNRKVKISEHNPIYGVPTIRQQGRELLELNLSITLITALGVKPTEEAKKIQEFMELGRFEHLVLGKQVMGEFPFLITGVSEKMTHFNPFTEEFDVILLEITLLEYVDNPSYYLKGLEYKKNGKEQLEEKDKKDVEKEQKKVKK